jgi:SRSO17 transposase
MMEGMPADGWEAELEAWLEPFLGRLRRQAQRRWAPFYLKGLILPGERKSIEPMAARVAPSDVQQLHHFVSTSPWATAPVEEELVRAADRLVGGSDAVLVLDDTALVKQGRHSVGVKRQYCGQLGKRANCQSLVSLTLGRAEMPVCVGLRLFLPEDWSADPARRAVVGVPEAIGYQPKWQIGLDEIDRVLASGARFGCVLADAEYGKAAEFRAGLVGRRLLYAVGILPTQKVYPADVTLSRPKRKATGRPHKHPVPSVASTSTAELLEARPELFRSISWRIGTMIGSADHPSPPGRRRWRLRGGPLQARFAALRVCVADGPVAARAQHLPGEEAWLVGEHRVTGERKYYLTNHPADTPLEVLAAAIKARWVCEQMHQQMKDELGLDHFEGRSWRGLHHHALLCQLAFAFLQHLRLRLGGKKRWHPARAARAATPTEPAGNPATHRGSPYPHPAALPPLPAALRASPPAMNMAK